ncbi:hypothetical protein NX059_001479 [Plenodomus lindquistii]|nr:hypothetical protein NX059_001479 [Plenodomus lindquistii]
MSSRPPAHLADYDVAYDTDTISLTSTAPSEQEDNYDAVKVLSERPPYDDEDHVYYLIEWEGYPMHRCTWEPGYHLDGTNLLELWELEKKSLGEAAAAELMKKNASEHLDANARAREAKEYRQSLRIKRRRKERNNNRRSRLIVDSGSESEASISMEVQRQPSPNTLLRTRELEDASQSNSLFNDSQNTLVRASQVEDTGQSASLFEDTPEVGYPGADVQQRTQDSSLCVRPAPTNRRPPLLQSDSSSSSRKDDDAETSEDSLLGEMLSAKKGKTNIGSSTRGTQSRSLQKAQNQKPRVVPQQIPITTTSGSAPKNNEEVQKIVQPPQNTATAKPTPLNPHPVAGSSGTVKPKPDSLKTMRRTEPSKTASGIRMVNQPRTQPTPWTNSDRAYSTLKFRRNAEKRGRAEAAPDPAALDFVGAPPPGMARPRHSPSPDVYGRREIRTRRPQESDDEDMPRRTHTDDVTPLHHWEAEKIPQVCTEWRLSNNCKFGARACRYMHRNKDASGRDLPLADMSGHIPPKHRKPPVTCRYWLLDPEGCAKPDEECSYAHWNTGYVLSEDRTTSEVIDPQRKPLYESGSKKQLTCPHWFYSRAGCYRAESKCVYAHRNTGLVADHKNHGSRTVIDLGLKPVHERAMNDIAPSVMKSNVPASKITCYFWTRRICRNTEDSCKYQHRDTGIVAADPGKTQTCKFWAEGGKCPNPRCKYQHNYMGEISGQRDNATPAFSGGSSRLSHESPPQDVLVEPDQAFGDTTMPDATHAATLEGIASPPLTILQSPQVDVQPSPLAPPPPTTQNMIQADTVCLTLKDNVERVCKLDFLDIFARNDGSGLLDRRAFLLYHQEQHAEELELITRWLLMHHVEVGSTWHDGSWDHFKQHTLKGGSGVIIAHPDFEYFAELSGFGQLLQKQIRIWSVGMQDGIEYHPHLEISSLAPRHDRLEIFPHGGFIYITDEVFEQKPQLALELVRQFSKKIAQLRLLAGPISPWHAVDDACLLWRLCVRPELTEYLFQSCEEQAEELDAGDPSVTSRGELYMMLAEQRLIDDSLDGLNLMPDKFPIMSERRFVAEDAHLDYFNTLARSQQEANLRMIHHYSLVQVEMRRDYRHFYVVHTDAMASYVQDWMHEVQSIAAVITPEMCLEELEKDGSVSMFDFCERYMPGLQVKDWKSLDVAGMDTLV